MAELSTLARPYAKAAFEFAVTAGDLQGWSQSLAIAGSVAQQSNVVRLLASPSVTAEHIRPHNAHTLSAAKATAALIYRGPSTIMNGCAQARQYL